MAILEDLTVVQELMVIALFIISPMAGWWPVKKDDH